MEKVKVTITMYDVNKMHAINPEPIDLNLLKYEMQSVCGYTFEDKLIDADYIINKYESYVLWWNAKYSSANKDFIPKDERLKSPIDFLNSQMHLQNFNKISRKDPRSIYIFGDLDKLREEYDKIY